MRKLKFRAWDREKYLYFDLFNVEGFICTDIHQFTGFKDINGKEIYEADILKDSHLALGIVKFHDGSYMLTSNYLGKDIQSLEDADYLYQDLINDNDLEIIGNIYENPELLEGVKK